MYFWEILRLAVFIEIFATREFSVKRRPTFNLLEPHSKRLPHRTKYSLSFQMTGRIIKITDHVHCPPPPSSALAAAWRPDGGASIFFWILSRRAISSAKSPRASLFPNPAAKKQRVTFDRDKPVLLA
jgi:hypothetical protein